MTRYDKKEKRALAVYFFIFFLLAMGIGVSGHVSYRNFEQGFRLQAEQQLSAIAELKVDGLVKWRRERLGDAEFLYQNPVFSTLVARYFDNRNDVEAQNQLIAWLEHYQAYEEYDGARLLDAAGVEKLSIPSESGAVDARLATDAAASLHSGKITFSDFQRDTNEGGAIHITILIPVFDGSDNDRPFGILALRIDANMYLYPYIQQWPAPSQSAETLLVRRDGENVLFLNELRFNPDAALILRFPLTDTEIPAVKAALGQTGVVEGLDYRGKPVLADMRPVPDSPWLLVSKMDTAEVFAPLMTRLWQTFGIIGMAIFAAGAGLGVVWRQQRILFYRTQAEAAEAIRESEQRFKSAFEYSAIGMALISLQGKWLKVNSKVSEIIGYSEDELLTKTFQDITHPDDLNADLKQVRQMLVGEIESYTMEKRYFHKDGRIVWVLLAVSLVKNSDGIPLYFLSQIEDISERKQVEETLKLKNFSIDNASDALFWTTPDARIVDVNAAACRSLGYTREELLQLRVSDVDIHYDAEIWPQHFSELRQAGSLRFESEQRAKDRRLIPVEIVANYVQLGTEERNCAFVRDITERKKAEVALQKSEERFKTMFMQAPLGIALVGSLTGHIYEVNPRFAEIAGRSMEEMVSIDWMQITHPDDMRADLDYMALLNAGKINGFQMEKRYLLPSGAVAWVNMTIAPLKVEDKTHPRHLCMVEDITERKRAEQALRESEQHYKLVSELASDYVYKVGIAADGKISLDFVTDSFYAITGRSMDEARTIESWNKIFHPDDLGKVMEFLKKLVITRQSGELECRSYIGDSQLRWIEIIARPEWDEQQNRVIAIVGAVKDITDRKQAEDALRESEERYRTVVSNAPVVTFVTDEKGIFTLSEGKGLAKLGLQPGQVVGLSVIDVYRDFPSIMDAMKNALAGQSHRQEVEVQGIVFDVFYTPVFDQDGKVVKVIGVSNDVTERKQAEDEVRQLNLELEQRVRERTLQLETTNKELEAFSYSVSHDLRAPLRGIDGWSQALLEDYRDQLDEQGRQYVDRVRSETQRMGRLIDDMLQLSRLTRAKMIKATVDLSALAQIVTERLKQDEPQRQVDFNIEAGLTAEGDSHLLEAVLANLLGNAFKFTAKRADARIEFGQTESQDERVFFVRDNGAGFDMAYSEKLFGAFQRMHKVSEFPGSGIGLATVQRIIHRHGGHVWADAEVGRGATFYFTLEEKI